MKNFIMASILITAIALPTLSLATPTDQATAFPPLPSDGVFVIINGLQYRCEVDNGTDPIGNICHRATQRALQKYQACASVNPIDLPGCFDDAFQKSEKPAHCTEWESTCFDTCKKANPIDQAECYDHCYK